MECKGSRKYRSRICKVAPYACALLHVQFLGCLYLHQNRDLIRHKKKNTTEKCSIYYSRSPLITTCNCSSENGRSALQDWICFSNTNHVAHRNTSTFENGHFFTSAVRDNLSGELFAFMTVKHFSAHS